MYELVEDALFYDTEATGDQSLNPLLVADGERFSQFVVDEDVVNSTDVLFIGTGQCLEPSDTGILQTKTLLLYLLIRGKLLHSGQHLWNRKVPLCPLYPLSKC